MSYSPKYQLRFKDLLGGDIVATMSFQDYLGPVTDLIGTGDPGSIEFDGDENTIYRPIHQCFAKLNVYEPPLALIQDLEDIEDTSVMLTITAPNRRFDGFIVADNISRPMDLKASTLSLDGIDIFSIMKGKILLDESGKVPYGKKTFRWFVERCLALGTANGFGFGINFVNDYHLNNASGLQLLDEVLFDTSSFKGDDGRPIDCYSIMERFAKSLFSKLHFAEGNLHFITPVSMTTDDYMNVATMTRGMQSGFLVGNLENFGALRGSKEVSCRYDFGKNNGLLKNFNFGDWSGGLPTEWQYDPPARKSGETTDIMPEKIGTGRPEAPYGIAIRSNIFKSDGRWFYFTSDLRQSATGIKGVVYSISLKFTYADYTQWYNKQVERNPAMQVTIFLYGVSGNVHTYKASSQWDGDGLSGWWVYPNPTNGSQNASVTLPVLPESGLLSVIVPSIDLDGDKYRPDLYPERSKVTLHSVILSEVLDGKTGTKDYLTQKRDYTQLLSVDDATIGNAPSEGVNGAMYNAQVINSIDGSWAKESVYPYLYKTGDSTPRTALHQLIRAYMATSRKAAKKVEFTVLSNQIRFGDILAINDQGRYIQVKNEYDLRNCKQKITAIELNKDFLPDGNTEATDTQDTYETYPTY